MGKKILNPEIEWELDMPKNEFGEYIGIPKKRNYSGITKTNKRRFPDGYIYFLKGFGTDYYKIGVSSNVKRRISDIDSYMPFDLQILSIHYFKNVYEVEDMIAKKLKSKKIRKEWYSLKTEEAKDIMIELHNLNVLKDVSPN